MLKATAEEQGLIDQVEIGSTVRHYKGMLMKVLGIARHTEDNSLLVIYQKLYDCEKYGKNAIVVRPLKMFVEKVKIEGQEVPRFEVVEQRHSCSCC